jgi:hypothetical protein
MTWVWEHSKSRHGARLVLLAIADAANADGVAYPSNKELRDKAGLGERSVQTAIGDLTALGELEVRYNAGPKGCNLYRVIADGPGEIGTPAESAPPQILRESSGDAQSPQVAAATPADMAPPQNLRGSDGHEESPQVGNVGPAESAPPQNRHPAESAPGTLKQDLSPSEKDIYIAREDDPPAAVEDPPPKRAKAVRGTRIPEDFAVTEAMAEWARREVPALVGAGRGKYETDRFVDYYRSASGANARKIDWPAAWRNWMRKAEDDYAGGRPAGRSGNVVPLAARESTGTTRARAASEAGRRVQALIDEGRLKP